MSTAGCSATVAVDDNTREDDQEVEDEEFEEDEEDVDDDRPAPLACCTLVYLW